MTTREIVKTIRSRSREPWLCAMRTMAIYILKKRGYDTRYVAMAFNVDRTLIPHIERRVENLLSVNDVYMLRAKETLSTHVIDLYPYFEVKTKKIRTYAKIDNTKI